MGMDESTDHSERPWRTREDPFAGDWGEIVELLDVMPELQSARLFDYLREKYPGRYEDGQLRTLQRRVLLWRAQHGPDQELFFDQVHVPGEALQLDWLDGNRLGVLIGDSRFDHKLCHCACVYSKWEWARVCFSEDFLSLRTTLQDALFRLGGVPKVLQVDNSSAATCSLAEGEGHRDFNLRFQRLLKHFGLTGRRVNIGCAHENGTIEKLHDHFRVRLDQALKLRGSRRFASEDAYESFVGQQLEKANGNRMRKLAEERRHLGALPASRYPQFEVQSHRIGVGGTVRINRKVYSVPSRLKGYRVSCRIYTERIELFVGATRVHSLTRVHGSESGIQWRDLVGWLVRKPGAFGHYRYRETMFPTAAHRDLHETLCKRFERYAADREYLLILNASAELDPASVAEALGRMLSGDLTPTLERFREAAGLGRPAVELAPFEPDLSAYRLFEEDQDDEQQRGDVSEELPAADHGGDA